MQVTSEAGELADLIRAEKQPLVLLLDITLPGTGRIKLMAEVPELYDLPVIFISGYGRNEIIAHAFEAGAADNIVKPVSATRRTPRVGVTRTATEYEIRRTRSVNAERVVRSEPLLRQTGTRRSTDNERQRRLPHGNAGRRRRAVPASPVRARSCAATRNRRRRPRTARSPAAG